MRNINFSCFSVIRKHRFSLCMLLNVIPVMWYNWVFAEKKKGRWNPQPNTEVSFHPTRKRVNEFGVGWIFRRSACTGSMCFLFFIIGSCGCLGPFGWPKMLINFLPSGSNSEGTSYLSAARPRACAMRLFTSLELIALMSTKEWLQNR